MDQRSAPIDAENSDPGRIQGRGEFRVFATGPTQRLTRGEQPPQVVGHLLGAAELAGLKRVIAAGAVQTEYDDLLTDRKASAEASGRIVAISAKEFVVKKSPTKLVESDMLVEIDGVAD